MKYHMKLVFVCDKNLEETFSKRRERLIRAWSDNAEIDLLLSSHSEKREPSTVSDTK